MERSLRLVDGKGYQNAIIMVTNTRGETISQRGLHAMAISFPWLQFIGRIPVSAGVHEQMLQVVNTVISTV